MGYGDSQSDAPNLISSLTEAFESLFYWAAIDVLELAIEIRP